MSRGKTSLVVALTVGTALSVLAYNKAASANAANSQDGDRPSIPELVAFQNAMTKVVSARGDQLNTLDNLMRQRSEAVQRELELRVEELGKGRGMQDLLLESARNAKNSALDLAVNKEQELSIRHGYYMLMIYVEKLAASRFSNGSIKGQDLEAARYARLDAHVQYLKAGGK